MEDGGRALQVQGNKDGKEGLPGFESWLSHWLGGFRHELLHLSEHGNAKNGNANGTCLS